MNFRWFRFKRVIPWFLIGTIILSGSFQLIPVRADASTDEPVYIVQVGDSLTSIANQFDVSISDLETANNISDADSITIGQQLIIPGLDGISGTLDVVQVQYGQTLRSLANQYQISEALLIKLNHLVIPDQLYAGDNLTIFAGSNSGNTFTRATLADGQSMLEMAIAQDENPWALVQYNDLSGTWDGISGETFDIPAVQSAQPAQATQTSQTTSTSQSAQTNDQSNGLPPVFTTATVDALPITQGATVQIKAVLKQAVSLSGSFEGYTLHFYPDGSDTNTYVALQGIEGDANPGVYPLQLTVTLADGSTQSFEQLVPIISGNFPHDSVIYSVDSKTIDPTYTVPDAAQVKALTASSTAEKYWDGIFIAPDPVASAASYISSIFGIRRSYVGIDTNLTLETFHAGMDYAAAKGQSIVAPASGIVVFTGPLVVCGNATYIYHGWGVYSGICHQSEIMVSVGQVVKQGDVIGKVGSTGRALGTNLHWEVWVNGARVNPAQWLAKTFPH